MPDFILEYDILETIAKSSKSLGKEAKDYSESLQSKIVRGIDHVTGQSSGYLINASDMVSDKINALKLKSDVFYSFAEQISNLLIVAEQTDQEVADIIAAQREYFLDHHESLRIEDWKAKLLDLLVDVKNSIPLLNLLANILKGLDSILEALADTVKHWYECGGGKYIINVVWSIGEVAFAIAGMVAAVTALATLAVPGAAFFAVCGIIGASIALVNGVTNVFTSCRGADAALDGNPALAVIYGKQDKLSDVLRQKNFGDGSLNTLSNLGAGALDLTETFCDIVGIAEIAGIAKLFQGNAFKQLKNGTLNFSDLKNGAKNGIVDLKDNIKNGYADLKKGSRLDDVGGSRGGSPTKLNYRTSSGLQLETTPGKTTTVLGTYNSDTGAILDELGNVKLLDFGPKDGGFNLLNTPDELYVSPKQFWNEYNKPWLVNVITRNDIIKIATEPTFGNLTRINKVTGKMELTGFGREFTYLRKNGYYYDTMTKMMTK